MRKIFICALLLGIFPDGFSQHKRICVMGSSSAWGYFTIDGTQLYPRDSGWAFKLKKHFKDLDKIDTLYNIAANSSNCYNGMPSSYVPPPNRVQYPPYYPFNITKAVQLVPKPDIIIVNYPTNQYDWLPVSEILFCLQTIKDSANAAGIHCFITTTQPRNNFSPAERQRLKDIRDMILFRFGPWAIDFWTDVTIPVNSMNPVYNLGDSIHLTPAGHTLLKNRVINANIFFTALPVSLTQFNVQKRPASVLLQWTTASETNSSHFVVQKSTDGKNFTALATVMAAGNSSQLQTYSAEDWHPDNGTNFYRIVSVDINQQKQFSGKQHVSFKAAAVTAGEIYANPVMNEMILPLASGKKEWVSVNIFSRSGKRVSSEKIRIDQALLYKKDCSRMPAGSYSIVVTTREGNVTRNFVKL